jgi:hypothetical protein
MTYALRSDLGGESMFFTHSRNDSNENFLSIIEKFLNLITYFTFRDLDIVLSTAGRINEVHEVIVDVEKGVFSLDNVGDIHVVCGRREIFELLSGEDLQADAQSFSMRTRMSKRISERQHSRRQRRDGP